MALLLRQRMNVFCSVFASLLAVSAFTDSTSLTWVFSPTTCMEYSLITDTYNWSECIRQCKHHEARLAFLNASSLDGTLKSSLHIEYEWVWVNGSMEDSCDRFTWPDIVADSCKNAYKCLCERNSGRSEPGCPTLAIPSSSTVSSETTQGVSVVTKPMSTRTSLGTPTTTHPITSLKSTVASSPNVTHDSTTVDETPTTQTTMSSTFTASSSFSTFKSASTSPASSTIFSSEFSSSETNFRSTKTSAPITSTSIDWTSSAPSLVSSKTTYKSTKLLRSFTATSQTPTGVFTTDDNATASDLSAMGPGLVSLSTDATSSPSGTVLTTKFSSNFTLSSSTSAEDISSSFSISSEISSSASTAVSSDVSATLTSNNNSSADTLKTFSPSSGMHSTTTELRSSSIIHNTSFGSDEFSHDNTTQSTTVPPNVIQIKRTRNYTEFYIVMTRMTCIDSQAFGKDNLNSSLIWYTSAAQYIHMATDLELPFGSYWVGGTATTYQEMHLYLNVRNGSSAHISMDTCDGKHGSIFSRIGNISFVLNNPDFVKVIAELTVNAKNTYVAKAKLVSAADSRVSAVTMGSTVALTVIIVILSCVTIIDLPRLGHSRCRQRCKRHRRRFR